MITRKKFLTFTATGALAMILPSALIGCGNETSTGASGGDDLPDTDLGNSNTGAPSGEKAPKYNTLTTFLFDTVIEIQANCEQRVLDEAEQRLIFFENTFSKTLEGSDIYAVNHAQGNPVEVHEETAKLIEIALEYGRLSDGLFDISIGGVVDLWDFINGVIPDPEKLAEALLHVDYRNVVLEGKTVTLLDPLAQIDLGGIAKGYIADDIARLLRNEGCTSAFINLGGNVYALGAKDDGSAWRVGLQDPNDARGTIIGVVPAKDYSVVTSGINERSFSKDGVTYHHLLDPSTGMPAQNGLASATIVSELSVDGDAFTTMTFLMGEEEARHFLEGHPDKKWLFVDTEGSISNSPDLEVEIL